MAGCFVEDCLKQFCAAELLENYRYSNCWHIAAIKFLSLIEGNEVQKISKFEQFGAFLENLAYS
ncbi:hypothetical protein LguiB_006028 [Lonicera macranthoides]